MAVEMAHPPKPPQPTFKDTISYIVRQFSNFIDRDDSLISKEAVEILSKPADKKILMDTIKRLREDDNKQSAEIKLSDRTIQIFIK